MPVTPAPDPPAAGIPKSFRLPDKIMHQNKSLAHPFRRVARLM
jgi:hypothetical protein